MVKPDDLVIDGWDINDANLYEAMVRAQVSFFPSYNTIKCYAYLPAI